VEVTIDNMSWVVSEGLEEPSWMFDLSKRMLKNNPSFWGSGVAFVPNYYSKRGKFFEPYAVRRGVDTIMTLQVGSLGVDPTKKEYFTVPVERGVSHWSEPYENHTDDKSIITTYSTPIRNEHNRIVGVVFADIATNWLEDVMNEEKVYESTQRFLVTGHYNMLAGKVNPVFEEALQILKSDNDKNGYFMMTSKDGVKRHVFYTPVGGKTDWVLINIVDDGEVFGRLRSMQMMMLLPLIIGLFFAWLIVWRSSNNLKNLKRVNAEKERIDSELQMASQIQQSLLPQGELDAEDVELAGFLKPAREVGGDIYDYFIRDGKLFFCIGDVSGKGAPSAILMAVIHALFRSASAYESNPARIMQTINETSCRGNDTNMFVTMFIGVLDLPTGNLRYCDAGHDAPIIMENGEYKMVDVATHLPLGVFDDVQYGVQSLTLQPDSIIFLYTDGLTEAKNRARRQFGLKRVQDVLEDCTGQNPHEMLETITKTVDGFVKNAEQSDDLTMLVIRYTPQQFESTLTETLTIKNDIRAIKQFSDFMKSATAKLDIDASLAKKLQLAVEEAVVNVIDYAYPMGTEGDITINMLSDGHSLHFQIIDEGVAFDPTSRQKADTTLSAEDRQIGGLGILLLRELMDSINYERTDGKNVLTLIKKLK
jgi:sigma-B regulation protein RsbU (phosphoserine phosphatase)